MNTVSAAKKPTSLVPHIPSDKQQIRSNLRAADKQFSVINKRLDKLDKTIKLMSKHDFVKMNEEMSYLHDRLSYMIDRETLVTELSFYARNKQSEEVSIKMNSAVIWALDQPEEWFKKLNVDDNSVKEVAFIVMQEYGEWRAAREANRKAG